MHIQSIVSQMGNDFTAILACEHCTSTQKLSSGYDDSYYHNNVLPAITCVACGKNRAGDLPDPNPSGLISAEAAAPSALDERGRIYAGSAIVTVRKIWGTTVSEEFYLHVEKHLANAYIIGFLGGSNLVLAKMATQLHQLSGDADGRT
jgi:hypothetical protein